MKVINKDGKREGNVHISIQNIKIIKQNIFFILKTEVFNRLLSQLYLRNLCKFLTWLSHLERHLGCTHARGRSVMTPKSIF